VQTHVCSSNYNFEPDIREVAYMCTSLDADKVTGAASTAGTGAPSSSKGVFPDCMSGG